MPERIAVVKLQGFVSDVGGQVVESVPGRIRVQLAEQKAPTRSGGFGFLSKLGLGGGQAPKNVVELEMLMEKREMTNATKLHITAVYKPTTGGRSMAMSPAWRQRCDELHRELRAYLMGRE